MHLSSEDFRLRLDLAHYALLAGHHPRIKGAHRLRPAADFAILPGDDDVWIEKGQQSVDIAFLEASDEPLPQLIDGCIGFRSSRRRSLAKSGNRQGEENPNKELVHGEFGVG